MSEPRLIVYSSLFPCAAAPSAGSFIRERMFRVARQLPIVVVAPQAWSPIDWVVRLFRPSFRPLAPARETMHGIEVFRPRFFCLPGVFKRLDGWLMARATLPTMRRLVERFGATIIDAHFLYPDGWAATQIGKRLGLPVTITIRGSKDEWLIGTDRERFLVDAMRAASHLFAVSDALKRDVAVRLGIAESKVSVVGNGVDLEKFHPVDRAEARRRLGLRPDATVLIGVGGLVPRKGFQRLISLLSQVRKNYPNLVYLIVGGGTSQGDMRPELEALARRHGVGDIVRFCGPQPASELKWFYGAADVFALATEHEGWANVFLEAMACGLPVVTTRVGGNAQVVADARVGVVVTWWDPDAFVQALDETLGRAWDRQAIIAYAAANSWHDRIASLVVEFRRIAASTNVESAQ